ETGHVADAVFVALALEGNRPAQRRRIEHDPPDGWPEQVVRQVVVVEGLAHEDPRRADGRPEVASTVDQGDLVAASGELGRDVQPGEPGTDDQDGGLHGSNRKMSPGWHSSTSQIASSVLNRTAFARPFLSTARLAGV